MRDAVSGSNLPKISDGVEIGRGVSLRAKGVALIGCTVGCGERNSEGDTRFPEFP